MCERWGGGVVGYFSGKYSEYDLKKKKKKKEQGDFSRLREKCGEFKVK